MYVRASARATRRRRRRGGGRWLRTYTHTPAFFDLFSLLCFLLRPGALSPAPAAPFRRSPSRPCLVPAVPSPPPRPSLPPPTRKRPVPRLCPDDVGGEEIKNQPSSQALFALVWFLLEPTAQKINTRSIIQANFFLFFKRFDWPASRSVWFLLGPAAQKTNKYKHIFFQII